MFTLGHVAESEAKAKAAQVDYRLMRLRQGLIEMPPISDVVAFFRHDGPPPVARSGISAPESEPTLANLRDRYLDTQANGTLEFQILSGFRRHFGHLARVLGESFPVRTMALVDLQGYVDARAKT